MFKSWVKVISSTDKVPEILDILSEPEATGIGGVAVKCIDTIRNADCEGK